MPNVLQRERTRTVDFVASPALDLLNCMYFTYLAGQVEGVEDWPVRARASMAPALRDELDLLFTYPGHQPGLMGALNDTVFFHRDVWNDADDLLRFVRDLPADGSPDPERPGIRGLALYALSWCGHERFSLAADADARDAFAQAIDAAPDDLPTIPSDPVKGGRDVVLAMFDDPEAVRARMLGLIRRFYDEHYRADEERRRRCMERSAARHRAEDLNDIDALLRRVTGRQISCIQDEPESYSRFIFVPSVDVGPYSSCADMPPVHGLHYPCEPETAGAATDEATDSHRMAQVYRALSDEQRLRILELLRDGELYAQEIVARTALHQSVVSRHLAFLKAVGLVNVRRQNNMKFFSLNTEMRDQLRQAMDSLLPAQARSKD
jgi:ArsR family transcriptional regulator